MEICHFLSEFGPGVLTLASLSLHSSLSVAECGFCLVPGAVAVGSASSIISLCHGRPRCRIHHDPVLRWRFVHTSLSSSHISLHASVWRTRPACRPRSRRSPQWCAVEFQRHFQSPQVVVPLGGPTACSLRPDSFTDGPGPLQALPLAVSTPWPLELWQPRCRGSHVLLASHHVLRVHTRHWLGASLHALGWSRDPVRCSLTLCVVETCKKIENYNIWLLAMWWCRGFLRCRVGSEMHAA